MEGGKKSSNRFSAYFLDSSIDIKERTFMLFSGVVLAALFSVSIIICIIFSSDGETWKAGDDADCSLLVDRHDFGGWDAWKKPTKKATNAPSTLSATATR